MLVVSAEEEVGRRQQGWQQGDFGACEVVVSPSSERLFSLVETSDAIHVFTGLCAFSMVEQAFKHSCACGGLRRFIYSEPWRGDGWRGFLRKWHYRYLAWKFADKVEALLLTGKLGVESYVRAGFPRHKCHEWGYFTEQPDTTSHVVLPQEHVCPRLIFIGTWDERKNILGLIGSLKPQAAEFECYVLGDGYLRPKVEACTAGDKRFKLIGNVPNTQIGAWLSACDILVLPSIFDGWGAVVNEALMCGTRALVSETCGAASLIVSPHHGAVFKHSQLAEALEQQLSMGCQTDSARTVLRAWAAKTLSGAAAARRLVHLCEEIP